MKTLAYTLAHTPIHAPLLLITPDAITAHYLVQTLNYWFKDSRPIYYFPDWETLPYDEYPPHPNLVAQRLQTLAELPHAKQAIILISANTLKQKLCPQTHLDAYGIHLKLGDTLPRQQFIARLIEAGYQPNPLISLKGEYSARGAVVDFFPIGANDPIRLEWLDDEIDTLRTFDLETQRTIKKLDKISILPAKEVDLSDAGRTCFRQNARQYFGQSIENNHIYQNITKGNLAQGIEYYLPLFFDYTATFFEYLPANTQYLLIDNAEEKLEEHDNYCQKRYQRLNPLRQNQLLAPDALWLSAEQIKAQLSKLSAYAYRDTCERLTFEGKHAARKEAWLTSIATAQQQARPICLHFSSNGLREHWLDVLQRLGYSPVLQEEIDTSANAPLLQLLLSPNRYSFNTKRALHLSETDLHAIAPPIQYRSTAQHNIGALIQSLQDLRIGAAVVHSDYGVGRYAGLTQLEPDGEELLLIEYAKGGKLYVPTDDLDLITRYSGSSETAPWHELGGKVWQTVKHKASQSVRDSAAELLRIYAAREHVSTQAITLDYPALAQLSASFPYEETPDQRAAIEAVLSDLASPRPMDRILCGDVGFGKTEIALRAAYAVIRAGQQVALIAPTTLLAEQHYQHFADRLANTGVQLDCISRFKSAKAQKQTLAALEAGQLDLIIGTHRLLQKDVAFSALGLVIIDEEQRFGVRHKEALKALRADVNLLTLTATPIPRTLNLALTGLRDLSIIATPPAGRQSVQTTLTEWHDSVIEEACERELKRGGQIYFLHNDVASIERVARYLQELLPQARIAIAHGQMRERELESIMQNFAHHHYDILIATTIIESGIDIANANTILIHRADKLGLAQLHQLRGRVGRSHQQAYAYLITPNFAQLSADAQRRLSSFTAIDSLGAGFLLASQDLDIRGAGEILGDQQTGQVQQIGMHYYLELLERAVLELKTHKDTPPTPSSRIEIALSHAAMLPSDYIADPQQRLVFYQKLAQAKTQAQVDAIKVELIDRFGRLPDMAKLLIVKTQLKLRAEAVGIIAIKMKTAQIWLDFSQHAPLNVDIFFQQIQKNPHIYQLTSPTSLRIQCIDEEEIFQQLDALNQFIELIALNPLP